MAIVPLILMLALFYAFLIIPQRKKQKATQALLRGVSVGDEILTTGGIYGGVVEIDGDDLYVEVAPNVEIKIARRAVAERVYMVNQPADKSKSALNAGASSEDKSDGKTVKGLFSFLKK